MPEAHSSGKSNVVTDILIKDTLRTHAILSLSERLKRVSFRFDGAMEVHCNRKTKRQTTKRGTIDIIDKLNGIMFYEKNK